MITVTAPVKRSATVIVRLQTANKEWLTKQANLSGFDSTAEYVDSLVTKLRTTDAGKKRKSK